MIPQGKHFIAGEWCPGDSNVTFQATNPVTLQSIGPSFSDPSTEQIVQVVNQAREAFPLFRKVSAEQKAQFLEQVSVQLEAVSSEIIQRAGMESGLSESRSTFEFARTVEQPRIFAKLLREGSWVNARIDTGDPGRLPRPKPDMRTMLQPIGPIAVFGASNFPMAISVMGTDSVSALAAGCPVIVKGHPAQPGTCELTALAVEKALQKFDLPSGVFSLIHGSSHQVGQELVNHPDLRGVAFTGSILGGRNLMDLAAARSVPIPVFAEMGSLNPVFLLPEALQSRPKQIVQGLVQSLTMDAGQFCTNPGVLIALDGPDLDGFVDQLSKAISLVAPQTMLHQGIHKNYQGRLSTMKDVDGVNLFSQSGDQDTADKLLAHTHLLETDYPTWCKNADLREECFGPSTILIRAKNSEEVEQFARNMSGSLTATLHGTNEDFNGHTSLLNALEIHVGRLVFNGFPTGVEIGHATHHGGPYPATSTQVHTSIGVAAIERFVRPVCYQNCPQDQLPEALVDSNPGKLVRIVDGVVSRESLDS